MRLAAVACVVAYFCYAYVNLYHHLDSIKEKSRSKVQNSGNDIINASESSRDSEEAGLQEAVATAATTAASMIHNETRCAINFFGLPRAFASIVLPSIVQNVIAPNAVYNCDYYVHYYEQSHEPAGRSGNGGELNTGEILLLRDQVELAARNSTRRPIVAFVKDSEDSFWKEHASLIDKIRNTKDDEDRYLYYPWKEKTYVYPTTTDNIIKMWHSIQKSWALMEETASKRPDVGEYSRVAMLRSDVLYMTPIDVWDNGDGEKDHHNKVAVIPAFGKWPVSDRLVYGPSGAVQVWASQRFERMESHALKMRREMPGYGLQSERFVKYSLFPAMVDRNFTILEHKTMCFFRARSDETGAYITEQSIYPRSGVYCQTRNPHPDASSYNATNSLDIRLRAEGISKRYR